MLQTTLRHSCLVADGYKSMSLAIASEIRVGRVRSPHGSRTPCCMPACLPAVSALLHVAPHRGHVFDRVERLSEFGTVWRLLLTDLACFVVPSQCIGVLALLLVYVPNIMARHRKTETARRFLLLDDVDFVVPLQCFAVLVLRVENEPNVVARTRKLEAVRRLLLLDLASFVVPSQCFDVLALFPANEPNVAECDRKVETVRHLRFQHHTFFVVPSTCLAVLALLPACVPNAVARTRKVEAVRRILLTDHACLVVPSQCVVVLAIQMGCNSGFVVRLRASKLVLCSLLLVSAHSGKKGTRSCSPLPHEVGQHAVHRGSVHFRALHLGSDNSLCLLPQLGTRHPRVRRHPKQTLGQRIRAHVRLACVCRHRRVADVAGVSGGLALVFDQVADCV
eukprot:Rhum_TRINITY_DN14799_c2_g2::Rhum_TRINITY_DN14799_c2_g2_i8::g.117031::m.117031